MESVWSCWVKSIAWTLGARLSSSETYLQGATLLIARMWRNSEKMAMMANRCIFYQGSVLPSYLRLTKLLWNCEEIFKIIPKHTDILQKWHQNPVIQHIYLSKLVIFDINAFSIHVNNTDVTKAAWCRALIPASPLWSGSQSKTCIFRGGIQAGTAVKWPWQH